MNSGRSRGWWLKQASIFLVILLGVPVFIAPCAWLLSDPCDQHDWDLARTRRYLGTWRSSEETQSDAEFVEFCNGLREVRIEELRELAPAESEAVFFADGLPYACIVYEGDSFVGTHVKFEYRPPFLTDRAYDEVRMSFEYCRGLSESHDRLYLFLGENSDGSSRGFCYRRE